MTPLLLAQLLPSHPAIVEQFIPRDADSGRIVIDGVEYKYRLKDVDAPEPDYRAKCRAERLLAGDAFRYQRQLTEESRMRVERTYGLDKYGRNLVDLSVDGRDLADAMERRGYLKVWLYDLGEPKPSWC